MIDCSKPPSDGYYLISNSNQTICPQGSSCVNGTRIPCDGVAQFQDLTGQVSCKAITSCGTGTYVSKSPSSVSNRECGACQLNSTYQDLSTHTSSSCKTVSTCSVGQAQTTTPTLTSDRSCTPCDGISQFQDQTAQLTWYVALC
jgi:hypothetical protein